MPKSKVRGNRKAHNKRVKKRNENISNVQKHIQKVWQAEFEKRMEEIKAESMVNNEDTQNNETSEEQVVNLSI